MAISKGAPIYFWCPPQKEPASPRSVNLIFGHQYISGVGRSIPRVPVGTLCNPGSLSRGCRPVVRHKSGRRRYPCRRRCSGNTNSCCCSSAGLGARGRYSTHLARCQRCCLRGASLGEGKGGEARTRLQFHHRPRSRAARGARGIASLVARGDAEGGIVPKDDCRCHPSEVRIEEYSQPSFLLPAVARHV